MQKHKLIADEVESSDSEGHFQRIRDIRIARIRSKTKLHELQFELRSERKRKFNVTIPVPPPLSQSQKRIVHTRFVEREYHRRLAEEESRHNYRKRGLVVLAPEEGNNVLPEFSRDKSECETVRSIARPLLNSKMSSKGSNRLGDHSHLFEGEFEDNEGP
jgi:hypothetical protein